MSKTYSVLDVINHVKANNGGTFSVVDDNPLNPKFNLKKMPKGGYIIGKKGGMVVPNLRASVISDFLYYCLVGRNVGFWWDAETNMWCIDEPRWMVNFNAAVTFARENNQKAIWDIAQNKEIEV